MHIASTAAIAAENANRMWEWTFIKTSRDAWYINSLAAREEAGEAQNAEEVSR
jgi:hypothetical protein